MRELWLEILEGCGRRKKATTGQNLGTKKILVKENQKEEILGSFPGKKESFELPVAFEGAQVCFWQEVVPGEFLSNASEAARWDGFRWARQFKRR